MAPTIKNSQELADRQHSVVFIEDSNHCLHQKTDHDDSMFQEFGALETLPSSVVPIAGPSANSFFFSLFMNGDGHGVKPGLERTKHGRNSRQSRFLREHRQPMKKIPRTDWLKKYPKASHAQMLMLLTLLNKVCE